MHCLGSTGLKSLAGAVGLGLLGLTLSAQTLSPGEVRISSLPYQPQLQVLRAESRLVQVEVVVRDTHGRAVGGLTKENFAVFDSGHLTDIMEFSVATSKAPTSPLSTPASAPAPARLGSTSAQANPPEALPFGGRWIGLFFDDINTPPGDLGRAKIAAKRFIKEAVESSDHVGLFTTSGGQILPFTGHADAVLKSMATVESHLRMNASGLKACPRITPYEAYLITKNDAMTLQAKVVEACACDQDDFQACDPSLMSTMLPSDLLTRPSPLVINVRSQAQTTWDQARLITQTTLDAVRSAVGRLAQMPGKRVVLFASSGFLSGDFAPEQDEITNEALRAGVVINSLDSKGLYAETPGRPLSEPSVTLPDLTMVSEARSLGDKLESEDSAMAGFAESTGGLLFRNNNDLDYGFRELGLAPAYAYELGFRPDEDGKYHKIKVELKNASHDFIQARPGYFAPTKESSETSVPTLEEKIDAEVRGSDEKSDFPATVTDSLATAKSGGRELNVQTRVDVQKLPFELQQDRHVEMLTFVDALYDSQGKFIVGKEAEMDLALLPQSYERFAKTGISGSMLLEAPPGTYRLRVVVQEAVKGETAAITKNVQIQ